MNDANSTALRLSNIVMTFGQGPEQLSILRGAGCAVQAGELVALVGPSGAGKSTLLHIAGLLERPTSGTIEIAGRKANGLDDRARTELRRRTIGFVYQFHRLLPEFSALENIVVPQMIAGKSRRAAAERGQMLLERVGLGPRANHRPGKLSGGEQQRVAIARALANEPALLLADEPTGNLDPHTAEGVFAVLRELIAETKLGALIATHNLDLARRMDRVIELRDGLLIDG
ncbi:MAG TPA: ABC transporter ATP-binding protein [Alphaproteobacteria bacterium]|jgi:lipoprotein-releasing system ATP-binding protein|nr:ABC transporter ATP-binding protein [Alphaproteobacteria bacterium]